MSLRVCGADAIPSPRVCSNMASATVNEFGQAVGASLAEWSPPPFPPHKALTGQYCQLEPLTRDRHLQELWHAQSEDADGARWTYLPYGPFSSIDDYESWLVDAEGSRDTQFYAIVVNGEAVGVVSYLRINPAHGTVEVGHLFYAQRLAKTRAATEAIHLLVANAFKLGYRRIEWKCDSLNLPSRNAATRLGFSFEGLFRQSVVYKGRDRSTTWFSIIDKDWHSGLEAVFERWLAPDNFNADGQQKLRLSDLTAPFVQAKSYD